MRNDIEAAIRQLKRVRAERESPPKDETLTRDWRAAVEALDFRAVCLVGYTGPIPVKIGSNATAVPVWVRVSKSPETAAEELDRDPVHEVVTLVYVWTQSDAHARRLKSALDLRILGKDPGMVALRKSWRDVPEWRNAWPILLNASIEDLRARREMVEVFDEADRRRRIRDWIEARMRGPRVVRL